MRFAEGTVAMAGVIAGLVRLTRGYPMLLSSSPPAVASDPIPEAFVSYSIEFSSFPDFAGNRSSPNIFSNNLLNNLGNLTGTKPYIRVGGNTQDLYLYDPSLETSLIGIVDPSRSPDYPTTISIGPSYFESYNTWPDTKFVHGFNMGLGGNNSVGWQTLLDTVPLACKALGSGKLLWWEYGNEPDLFARAAARPPSWNEATYVSQWLNGTRAIKLQLGKYCPELTSNSTYGYLAPSFASLTNQLNPVKAWQSGLDVDEVIKLNSHHNYINGANRPGVTLQGTLMNHTVTVQSVHAITQLQQNLSYTGIPFILGETNSLYNQGKPGLSNTFGAALWGIDFNLYCASVGIRRVHMHMGTNYRYQSWQPIHTNTTTVGTKPPYYGNIVVAAMMGDLTKQKTRIANIQLEQDTEAAYAAYSGNKLARVVIINMKQYNYTVNGTSSVRNTVDRLAREYTLKVPADCGDAVRIQRLYANGSDAISGISWDGFSYNWELDNGNPVRLHNITNKEITKVEDGSIKVSVLDSEAVILNFN